LTEGGYSWRFSTIAPQVLYASPERDAKLVSVEPVISLTFNQPIASDSAKQSFQLVGADGPVPGALQIVGETLVFTPGQQLKFDQRYEVVVAAGLQSVSGGAGMKAEWRQAFQTVPLPRIVRTAPADGERAAEPYNGFTIYFNAPINPDTVMANLSMTPAFSPTQVFTYFNSYDNSFVLNYDVKPSTDYLVRIGPNIADPYGNLTGQSLSVSYRTAPLPPQVTLFAPSPVGVYSAAIPARIGLSSVNQPTASLKLYSIDAEQLRLPQWEWGGPLPSSARELRAWSVPLDTPLDERRLTAVDLVEGGGKLAPGAYAVTLDQPGSNQPQTHIMAVSDLSITLKGGERDAMAWVTNSVTGEPVAGVEVEFSDNDGAALGTATTDAQGVAALKLKRTEDDGLAALIRQPFSAMNLGWSNVSPLWEMGIQSINDLPELTAHLYTERSIYRPGDKVRFKGVVRAEDDVRFSLPATVRQAEVTITDANGQQVYQETRQLNANGAFDGELTLAAGAALGSYSINVAAADASFYAGFQVAAYRAPEFEVKVTPAAKEYVRGTASSAAVEVSYFFGGPVANVPVQWNIISSNHYFSPEWAERFDFGAQDDPWYCGRCWWREPEPTLPLLSGSGATDAQGRLVINLPADLKDSAGKPITSSLDLVIEATATGKDNQVIAGRASAVVHRADFYVGLAARTYVAKAGEAQAIDVVTASAAGQRLPNQTVELEVFKVSWDNRFIAQSGGGYWESTETRTSVARQSVTTDATASGAFSWTPAEAGSYQVVARGRDGAGREVRSSTFVWVSGDTFSPWLRDNDDTINLISDKTSYKPGETATILIPSPFQGPHLALISVERGGILSHEVRRLTSNSGVYQLALNASHAPNVYVSVVLLAPPAATGRPGAQVAEYKLGVLPLAVAPDPQTLDVKLTPAAGQALPGQELRYDVQVTDKAGAPVAAELSLDLVDKAVLSLAPRPDNAVLEAFYGRRPLGVATASTIALSAERFQEEFAEELERQQEQDEERQRGGAQPPMEDGFGYNAGDTAAGAAAPAAPA
ncbi:MAG TPA: Ig-like domain-containing protein, partial [Herpetosiphonaceae bacterium]